MPAALLDEIKAVDGVEVAEGSVTGYAQLVGKDGKAVTTGGAPSLGVSISTDARAHGRLDPPLGAAAQRPRPRSRSTPRRPRSTGYTVGDRVKVLFQGPARTFTVTGIVGFGDGRQPRRGHAWSASTWPPPRRC